MIIPKECQRWRDLQGIFGDASFSIIIVLFELDVSENQFLVFIMAIHRSIPETIQHQPISNKIVRNSKFESDNGG